MCTYVARARACVFNHSTGRNPLIKYTHDAPSAHISIVLIIYIGFYFLPHCAHLNTDLVYKSNNLFIGCGFVKVCNPKCTLKVSLLVNTNCVFVLFF